MLSFLGIRNLSVSSYPLTQGPSQCQSEGKFAICVHSTQSSLLKLLLSLANPFRCVFTFCFQCWKVSDAKSKWLSFTLRSVSVTWPFMSQSRQMPDWIKASSKPRVALAIWNVADHSFSKLLFKFTKHLPGGLNEQEALLKVDESPLFPWGRAVLFFSSTPLHV